MPKVNWICNICYQEFPTKSQRDSHFRAKCQMIVSLKRKDGQIFNIQKIDGIFSCECGKTFQRSNQFLSHSKHCISILNGMIIMKFNINNR
jgi:hypothetical protein